MTHKRENVFDGGDTVVTYIRKGVHRPTKVKKTQIDRVEPLCTKVEHK